MTEEPITTILRLDGTVLTITQTVPGSFHLTVEWQDRRGVRIIPADLADDHFRSPAFSRIVHEMKAELSDRRI